MSADALPSVDGRRARRDQNRERVVDALLEIYRDGDLQPSVAAVAERSGVSHRSVFRYFDDLDELYRVAVERQYRSLLDYLHLENIGEGPLNDRIEQIVERRLDLYEVAAPVARVGQMMSPVQPVIEESQRRNASDGVRQIRRHFKPELAAMGQTDRNAVAEAAAAVLSIDHMEYLCHMRQLHRSEAGAALRRVLRGLFAV